MADVARRDPDDTSDKKAAVRRDLTKGSISHNLLSLSGPIIVSEGLRVIGPTIDMIWVGKLGVASVAGVGIAGSIAIGMMVGLRGLNTGMRAMIARFVGAGDAERANSIAQQALVISSIYAVVIAMIGIFFSESVLSIFGVEADVVTEGAAYMRIILLGMVTLSFYQASEGIMQASGDAVTPMRISIIFRAFHLVFCPFLIFGWWIFPRLGVSGAAVSNVASQILGMVLGLLVLFTGRTRLRLTMKNFRLDLKIIWRIIRIGIPAASALMGRMFGRLGLMWFMAPFGTLAVAGHILVERIEVLITIPGFGFGLASGALVGQNMGAQQPGRAEKSVWIAVGLAEGIMAICTLAVLLWPGSIIRVFSPDPDLVKLTSVFLTIAAAGFLTLGFEAVLGFSLAGAGDTVPPMLITMFGFGVQLFLAFLLPQIANLEVYGVRWAIVIGMVAGTVVYISYFRLGRWKRKKV